MKTDGGVNATAATSTPGAYLDLGSGEKILNGFKGAQNENLYLGTYDGKPVKWRVLAVNDTTYGGSVVNNLLLFADYSLGSTSFTGAPAVGISGNAQKFANPDGYYGTSKVRAYMNGGYYLTSATTLGASVAESDSLVTNLLSGLSDDLLNPTTTVTYVGRRMIPAGTSPGIRTVGNDLAKSMANSSQWTDWSLNSNTSAQIGGANINTKTGSVGSNNTTTNFSNLATNGIVHSAYNDKLFLLSYDDVMRADYGFADENGIYLDQGFFANVTSTVENYKANGYRAGYVFSADAMMGNYVPGWPQDPYESTNPYPKSSAEFLSASDNVDYWLRTTLMARAAGDTAALCVWSNHVDWAFTYSDSSTAGVRPASVLNASKIGYVTPAAIGANFASAGAFSTDKPEYKLFVKDAQMGSNSTKAKALYSVSGDTLKVSYNNPTGKTSGNITVLISDKTKSDGSVAYQAAKAISASATADHYITESFTLPTGLNMSNYNVSVLFTSDTSSNYTADGANATETIYASYTVSNGIPVPQDVNGLEYDGKCKWIGSLGDKAPDWVITDIYCNTSYMTVEKIMYTGVGEDAEEEDVTASGTGGIVNAGKYVITMKLASGQTWSGTDPTADKTFTINIGQKKSTVKPIKKDGEPDKIPFDSAGLPELIQDEGGTDGTFTWDEGEEATAGTKKYKWTFTPESDNYTTEHGEMELTYIGREMTGISATFDTEKAATTPIYTSTSDDILKTYIVVTATYSDDKTGTITAYKFEIDTIDGKLEEGDNTLIITTNDDSQTCELTIPDVIAVVVDKINTVTFETKEFTYPVTVDEIKAKITAMNVHWNDNKSGKLEDLTDVTVSGTLDAGNKVTITIGIDGTELTKTVDIKINQGEYKIDQELFKNKSATYTGTAFTLDGWIDEDELPDGVTVSYTCTTDLIALGEHTVTAVFSHSNANYKPIGNMTATLTISNKPAHDMTGTEFKPEAGGGLTSDGKGGYTGTYSPDGGYDIGIDPDTLPDGVTVKDTTIKKKNPETQEWEPVDKIDGAGEYKVDVSFDGGDDYQDIDDMSTTVTIGKGTHDMGGAAITPDGGSSSGGLTSDGNGGFTGTYKPDGGFDINIDPDTLPDGVTVKEGFPVYKKYIGKGEPEFKADGTPKDPTKWINVDTIGGAGKYIAEIEFDYDEDNYEEIKPVSTVIDIGKADVDASGTTVAPAGSDSGLKPSANGGYTATYKPGGNYEVTVDPDSVPEGATPKTPVYKKYTGEGKPEFNSDGTPANPENWVSVAKPDGVGDYVCVIEFEPENKDNYNEIDPVVVVLTLSDKAAVEITATLEDGAAFTTANTLDELKAKLTATVTYDNGDGEQVKVADLDITCGGLRDGGKLKAGRQTITIKYSDSVETTVEIEVAKVKVALPTFKGGLSYTGVAIKPTVDNFNGYDSALMTFVTDKLQSGLAVGSYKAVFALNDPENYEWATAKTLSKSVFAAVVYDEEVTLLAHEAAVDWNISKAVLTATKKDNALPVFASESFIGELGEVVTLRYYTDETCTEEIAAEALEYSKEYFVKAELLDTDNFELDASAAQYTVKSFSYTTPAKALTGFEKVLAVVKANWLWIVIAVVALILLILIIALAVRSSKKKREREERRLAEEKAERERKEEERERREEERRQREDERRREEREERMAARMAQPQMMPQMPMQQSMPQSMPAAQPAAAADSAQLARIEAELAHVMSRIDDKIDKLKSDIKIEKLESAMANGEVATLRNDVNALRNELTYAKREEQVVQGGISLDKLTELIRTEVNNALDGREKVKTAPAPAVSDSGAATQVPPDAVMTTVTTTKIDTTKKPAQPAQNAQAAAPVRTVVRNVVAPMPVDDGRVFDVGGFYKPADPLTDMGFTDEENKD